MAMRRCPQRARLGLQPCNEASATSELNPAGGKTEEALTSIAAVMPARQRSSSDAKSSYSRQAGFPARLRSYPVLPHLRMSVRPRSVLRGPNEPTHSGIPDRPGLGVPGHLGQAGPQAARFQAGNGRGGDAARRLLSLHVSRARLNLEMAVCSGMGADRWAQWGLGFPACRSERTSRLRGASPDKPVTFLVTNPKLLE